VETRTWPNSSAQGCGLLTRPRVRKGPTEVSCACTRPRSRTGLGCHRIESQSTSTWSWLLYPLVFLLLHLLLLVPSRSFAALLNQSAPNVPTTPFVLFIQPFAISCLKLERLVNWRSAFPSAVAPIPVCAAVNQNFNSYLALVGDKVDNIPGVPGVGPKTAARWLSQHDTVAGLVARAAEIKGKVGKSLRDSLPQLGLSHELATVKIDVDLDGVTVNDLVISPPESVVLRGLLIDLEFESWLTSLNNAALAPGLPAEQCQIVLCQADFDVVLGRLRPHLLQRVGCWETQLHHRSLA
jgi:hypothetical protein